MYRRKEDIRKWFYSFNTPDIVVNNAINNGVVDGASFLSLVDKKSLVSWGVSNRIILQKILHG